MKFSKRKYPLPYYRRHYFHASDNAPLAFHGVKLKGISGC